VEQKRKNNSIFSISKASVHADAFFYSELVSESYYQNNSMLLTENYPLFQEPNPAVHFKLVCKNRFFTAQGFPLPSGVKSASYQIRL
jgi:hypothetical protein